MARDIGSPDRSSSSTKKVIGGLVLAGALGAGGYAYKQDKDDRTRHENLSYSPENRAEYYSAPSRQVLRNIILGEVENHPVASPELQQVSGSLIEINRSLNQCVDAYDRLAKRFRMLCTRDPNCMNQLVTQDPAAIARFTSATSLTTRLTSNLAQTDIIARDINARAHVSDRNGHTEGISLESAYEKPLADLQSVINAIRDQQEMVARCGQLTGTLQGAIDRLQNEQPVVPPQTNAGNGQNTAPNGE